MSWQNYHGYTLTYAPGHPVASRRGIAAAHRLAMYELVGPGRHPCLHCGLQVSWDLEVHDGKHSLYALVIDHLTEVRHDTRVWDGVRGATCISCVWCNTNRRPVESVGLSLGELVTGVPPEYRMPFRWTVGDPRSEVERRLDRARNQFGGSKAVDAVGYPRPSYIPDGYVCPPPPEPPRPTGTRTVRIGDPIPPSRPRGKAK